MTGEHTKISGPPFSCSIRGGVNDEFIGLRIESCSSLELGNVGSMTYLSLSISTHNPHIFCQRNPFRFLLISAHILNSKLEHGIVKNAWALSETNVAPMDHVALMLDKPLLLAEFIGSAELFDLVVPSLLSAHLIKPVIILQKRITFHEINGISVSLSMGLVQALFETIGFQTHVEVTLVSFFLEIRIDDLFGPAAGHSLFWHYSYLES